jgi:hypothetical protein
MNIERCEACLYFGAMQRVLAADQIKEHGITNSLDEAEQSPQLSSENRGTVPLVSALFVLS